VPYPCFLIYGTCRAHILDIFIFYHIHLCIGYNHSDVYGMICAQHQTFSSFSFPLRNYQAKDYHSEVPYL
jgi:hypothetical protein